MWLGLGLALPPCRLTRGIGVCRRKPNPDLQGGSLLKAIPALVCLLILALAVIACAPAAPPATPNIPATVTARLSAIPTATPYPTFTPYPTPTKVSTATPYPTATPLPTATPYPTPTALPTYTPYPTATAYPTYTPYPTPTPTPRPTSTPRPTATPIPTVKWGLPYQPVSIRNATSGARINTEPFILRGCYAGIAGYDGSSFTFTDNGKLTKNSKIAEVTGFAKGTFLSSLNCYNMAVQFKEVEEYCYYTSSLYIPPFGSCTGFTRSTPVFRLINPDSFERWRPR